MGEKIGYARVSTIGQVEGLDAQIEKLKEYGCQDNEKQRHIFKEKVSGAQGKHRPALDDMLRFVRKGDTLVITRLDRLARSVSDLTKIASQLQEKGVDLVVIEQAISTESAESRLLFHMISAIGEFERDLINSRTSEGRARAMAAGVKFGRKPALDDDQVAKLIADVKAGAIPKTDIAKSYGIGTTTLYRIYNEANGGL